MASRQYSHLNDLSQIRFLVIDEADRMVQQGSFPQLANILDAVQRANPEDEEEDDSDEGGNREKPDCANVDDGANRLLGLPGIPGEAKLVMLNDHILEEIERARRQEQGKQRQHYAELEEQNDETSIESGGDDGTAQEELSLPVRPPVRRQTFVYSATLTLPSTANVTRSKRARLSVDGNVDGAIAEILEKSRANGKTKVIDLSNVNKNNNKKHSSEPGPSTVVGMDKSGQISEETFRLPCGLSLQEIKCTQRHKDSHLYAYLMTTVDGSAGPCLVFCNSIACVRRVGSTLQALGMDVRILHAQMQQVRSNANYFPFCAALMKYKPSRIFKDWSK